MLWNSDNCIQMSRKIGVSFVFKWQKFPFILIGGIKTRKKIHTVKKLPPLMNGQRLFSYRMSKFIIRSQNEILSYSIYKLKCP